MFSLGVPAAQASSESLYLANVSIRGAGRITGPGIDCSTTLATPDFIVGGSGDCTQDYGSFVGPTTITASLLPGASTFGWQFSGWTGCPNPSGLNCTFGGVFDPSTYTPQALFDDISAPAVSITGGPAPGAVLSSTTATFTFSSPDPNATFRCTLDVPGDPLTFCFSPATVTSLSQGPHTFRIRANDPSGNFSATQTRTWTVDTVPPPAPTILSGPAAGSSVTETTATFTFSSEVGATFECALDSLTFVACTSPRTYSGLGLGPHTFRVRARDNATPANISAVTERAWTVITPQAKSLTLKAKPKRVERGKRTRLTAVVSPCAGHEGDVVAFYRGAKKIATKASDGACVAKMKVKMRKTAKFRAVSPQQDPDHLAGTSNIVKVRVI
jgi:hypothetical protein